MKEFTTAAHRGETEWIEFKVDDDVFRAVAKPKPSQLAMLTRAVAPTTPEIESVALVIDMINSVLDAKSQKILRRRLLDQNDPLDFEVDEDEETPGMRAILEWLVEQWSGRPTSSPSGSSTSRRKTGKNSTAVSASKELTP